jgi:hypothetical protein
MMIQRLESSKYYSLPTWLCYRAFRRVLPKSHAWKGTSFGLENWHEHSTEFTQVFNLIFWLNGVSLILCILIILRRNWYEI